VGATEFFAIETAALEKLAPTDAALESLSRSQLDKISIVRGWYDGDSKVRFQSPPLRAEARFRGSAALSGGPRSITYHIDASNDPADWSLLSEAGTAIKKGNQYITEGWRKRRIVVILRFVDLKQ
jgi:hypothetical protein